MRTVKKVWYTGGKLRFEDRQYRSMFVREYNFADRLSHTITKCKVKKLSDSKFCKKMRKRLERVTRALYVIHYKGDFDIEYSSYCTNVVEIVLLCINSLELHSCKIVSVD